MKYPALDVSGLDQEWALAVVDDHSPAAVQEHAAHFTIFFTSTADRDRAHEALAAGVPSAILSARDVDDEDWARQSQENLQPVTVGRLTVAPPWAVPQPPASSFQPLTVVIQPSMGFGTGHHATTRLCLDGLQKIPIEGLALLDVGTGSGVLALAARCLGAARSLGIDNDPDAIQSATENLALNAHLGVVDFALADLAAFLGDPSRHSADVVTANLTGALLVRSARLLADAVRDGGYLILSGLMRSEEADVLAAFQDRTRTVSITSEDEWVALILEKTVAVNRPAGSEV